MSEPRAEPLPRPAVRKRGLLRILAWLLPLAAAAAAAYYAREAYEEEGPLVSVEFADASGIRVGDTPVRRRGVEIGTVERVELSPDKSRVRVRVRLERGQGDFARAGAAYWLVGPEFSGTGLSGVSTLFSGPYIEAQPGKGRPLAEFAASDGPPEAAEGVRLVLKAPRLLGLQPGAPVTFRGFQVGVVRDVRLDRDSGGVELDAVVWRRYRALVRARTRFWILTGFDFKGGLLKGFDVKVSSLRSLVSGGVAFATPGGNLGEPAADGWRFSLEEQAPKDWANWAPSIPIEPAGMRRVEAATRLPTGQDMMESKLK